MRIIPAIDIIGGKCVRLTQGDYSRKKIYGENPVETAKAFEDAGIRYLHLVDLDGAKNGKITNFKIIEAISAATTLQIDAGGGLQSDEDVRIAFESGAAQITGGSVAARNPEMFLGWLERYGSEKIILGADSKNGKIAADAWQSITGHSVLDFIAGYARKGIEYTICTDIMQDGMLQGPNTELYATILQKQPGLKLAASGGISSKDDLKKVQEAGCEGAIIGKAIYENRLSLKDLEEFL